MNKLKGEPKEQEKPKEEVKTTPKPKEKQIILDDKESERGRSVESSPATSRESSLRGRNWKKSPSSSRSQSSDRESEETDYELKPGIEKSDGDDSEQD